MKENDKVIHLEPGETLPGYKHIKPVPEKYISQMKGLIDKLNHQNGSIYLQLKQIYAFLQHFNKDFVSGFTSCKKGCSHCCKIDIQLTPIEAQYIAFATKIPPAPQNATTGHNSPCPFLSEKEVCSIYNYRPLLCRTYHSLSEPELCKDASSTVMQYGTAKANMGNFIYKTAAEWIYFQVQQATGRVDIADIRDFFPYDREDIQKHLKNQPPRPPC
ncbi:YkgJ family cysteine cluster protein [Serratia nevei]|uniref:YkgJ family cysteine cluster protein n=1 Tax=Serratia nevei TaxID=2703794 RepID=UPI003F773ABE